MCCEPVFHGVPIIACAFRARAVYERKGVAETVFAELSAADRGRVVREAGADCALGNFGEVDILCDNEGKKEENENI